MDDISQRGLNFDPSHLVWLMIDIESAIEEFGSRFYHFQAKDVMIDYRGLQENGILSAGTGWQIPRLPGPGDIDWGRVFSASTGSDMTGRSSSNTKTTILGRPTNCSNGFSHHKRHPPAIHPLIVYGSVVGRRPRGPDTGTLE